jgi:hypothetical protein
MATLAVFLDALRERFGAFSLSLSPRALDLQPIVAAVDSLVDRRRRIDRLAVGPHPLVPALAEQPIRSPEQGLTLGSGLSGLCSEDRGHRARPAELLQKSISIRSGLGVPGGATQEEIWPIALAAVRSGLATPTCLLSDSLQV